MGGRGSVDLSGQRLLPRPRSPAEAAAARTPGAGTRAATGPLPWTRLRSCTPRAGSPRQPLPEPAATGTPSGRPHWRPAEYLAWGHFSPPPPGRRAQLRLRKREQTGASAKPQCFSFRTIFPRDHRSSPVYGVREGPNVIRLEKVLLGAEEAEAPTFCISNRLSSLAPFVGKVGMYLKIWKINRSFLHILGSWNAKIRLEARVSITALQFANPRVSVLSYELKALSKYSGLIKACQTQVPNCNFRSRVTSRIQLAFLSSFRMWQPLEEHDKLCRRGLSANIAEFCTACHVRLC